MRHAVNGVGSFDIQSRQVLWKYASMAWLDGWPAPRASARHADSEDEEEEEQALILRPLPKEAVHDIGDGRYRFRNYKIQADCFEEAWRLLEASYQEEQL